MHPALRARLVQEVSVIQTAKADHWAANDPWKGRSEPAGKPGGDDTGPPAADHQASAVDH